MELLRRIRSKKAGDRRRTADRRDETGPLVSGARPADEVGTEADADGACAPMGKKGPVVARRRLFSGPGARRTAVAGAAYIGRYTCTIVLYRNTRSISANSRAKR